jgi:hypothetical protein
MYVGKGKSCDRDKGSKRLTHLVEFDTEVDPVLGSPELGVRVVDTGTTSRLVDWEVGLIHQSDILVVELTILTGMMILTSITITITIAIP